MTEQGKSLIEAGNLISLPKTQIRVGRTGPVLRVVPGLARHSLIDVRNGPLRRTGTDSPCLSCLNMSIVGVGEGWFDALEWEA